MQRHLAVNYGGALHLLDAVLPMLLATGQGHLALVGSVAGYRGLPMSLAYGPTKAALNNLAENLYLDLHDLGLGVSIINPGFVDTPLTAQNLQHAGPDQRRRGRPAHAARLGTGRFEMNFPRRFTRAGCCCAACPTPGISRPCAALRGPEMRVLSVPAWEQSCAQPGSAGAPTCTAVGRHNRWP
jgi:NAD(P)-dependent dehydrogenase (short-subunit alcohol dehydrogenase family)